MIKQAIENRYWENSLEERLRKLEIKRFAMDGPHPSNFLRDKETDVEGGNPENKIKKRLGLQCQTPLSP